MNEEIMVFQVIYNEEFKDFQVKTMPTSKANNKYAKMFMGKFHPIYPRFNTIPNQLPSEVSLEPNKLTLKFLCKEKLQEYLKLLRKCYL